MSKHYIYLHRRASDGRVFYVGKGSGKRAWTTAGRNRHWHNVAKKHGHTVEIYRNGLSEECSFSIERILIAAIGRGNLCNLTDGGEGISGLKRNFSKEHRMKIAIAATGRKASQATKDAMSAGQKGKIISESHRKALSDALKGHLTTDETKSKISEAHKGKAISQMHKDAISNKLGKMVACSNGETFISIGKAAEWLRSNGHPNAAPQSISRVCKDPWRKAYNLKWSFI